MLREEIFGPVLAVERVRDVDDALDRVDGAALRADRRALQPQPADGRARRRARTPVGNLYVNREITGAMVGRQPFGGNRLSGTGHEGRRPRLPAALRRAPRVTENTVRHGLVV